MEKQIISESVMKRKEMEEKKCLKLSVEMLVKLISSDTTIKGQ